MLPDEITQKREEIVRIAQKHGVSSVRLFGSYARGEQQITSDIDLLVTIGKDHSRWFPGGLVADLEDLMGHRVDVIEEEALSSEVKKRIIMEFVLL